MHKLIAKILAIFAMVIFIMSNINSGTLVSAQNVTTTPTAIYGEGYVSGNSASQSSTLNGKTAGNAIDGDTATSYSSTLMNPQAWWQVDLGAVYNLTSIEIWNRTDNGAKLTDFYVFISATPFQSTRVADTLSQTGVSYRHYQQITTRPLTITLNEAGQYIRIQLAGTDFLQLSEVKVFSTSPSPTPTNTATITLTPTITNTPTKTSTPTITSTFTATSTTTPTPTATLPPGTMSGSVTGPGGVALADINIDLISINDFTTRIGTAHTNANGIYVINGIPEGQSFIVRCGDSYISAPSQYYKRKYWSNTTRTSALTLTRNAQTPNFPNTNFTLVYDNPTFSDVAHSNQNYAAIEALYAAGYISGCSSNPLSYCPDLNVTRAEAAVFILRGAYSTSYVPPTPTGIFADDWSLNPWAQSWAEGMYNAGFTSGCSASPRKYCPWLNITRAEVSVWLVRMEHGTSYTPPTATGTVFNDMTDINDWSIKWTEQAYKDGLIMPCGYANGKPNFCPTNYFKRGEFTYAVAVSRDLLP